MIVVVTNKAAGPESAQSPTDRIKNAFGLLSPRVEIIEVNGNEITNTARDAVSGGATIVVAAGGDGTVNAVATALVGTTTALGVLPMGTLNHFAKDAGIPIDLAEAAALITSGSQRAIDVAAVNETIFINNSSIGLYPLMVRDREKQRSRFKRSKWWAMVLASATIFTRFPTFGVSMTLDGRTTSCRTPGVFIGNNVYKLDMINAGTREALDAGLLSVYSVRTLSRWRTLGLAFSVLFSRLEESDVFDVAYTEECWLNTNRKNIDVSVDGEVMRMQTPLHYEIKKLSLQVILPVQPMPLAPSKT